MNKPDFQNILQYALRSKLAYSVSELGFYITKLLQWQTLNLSLNLHIKDLPDTDINTIVEIDDQNQCQWIAIRGSSNLKNWLLDFDDVEKRVDIENPLDNCSMTNFHTGFYLGAMNIYNAILSDLNPKYKTHITGHSLGGAIAAILMIFLQHQGYPITQCITFGQPKITNKIGAKQFKDLPLLRVINHEDIVPTLPPNTLLNSIEGEYEHFGAEIILQTGDYEYRLQHQPFGDEDNFWPRFLKTAPITDLKNLFHDVKDHNLSRYILHLLSNLENPDLELQKVVQASMISG